MKNEITNLDDCHINISKVGKYNKFVDFTSRIDSPDDVSFKYPCSLTIFSSDTLEYEKLDKKIKIESLKNMIIYLKLHVENQIEMDLILEKEKLYKKYNEIHHIDKLCEKLKLMQDREEASLTYSE